MAAPKHRVTITRRRLKTSTNKCFCNRSIQLNEFNLQYKIKKNELFLLYYLRSTISSKFRNN